MAMNQLNPLEPLQKRFHQFENFTSDLAYSLNITVNELAKNLNITVDETVTIVKGFVTQKVLNFNAYIEQLNPGPYMLALYVIIITYLFLSPKPLDKLTSKFRPGEYFYLIISSVFGKLLVIMCLCHVPPLEGFDLSPATAMAIPIYIFSYCSILLLHGIWTFAFKLGIHKSKRRFCRDFFELYTNAYTVTLWVMVFTTIYSSDLFKGSTSYLAANKYLDAFADQYVAYMHGFRSMFFITLCTVLFLCALEHFIIVRLGIHLYFRFISSGLPPEDRKNDSDRPDPDQAEAMTSWYSLYITHTMLDMILSGMEFLGRSNTREVIQAKHTVETFSEDEELSKLGVFDLSSYENDNEDFFFDWMADCGDGFNPSYQVARGLAQPELSVKTNHLHHDEGLIKLPRAKVLIIGGDLAYPNPTDTNYENRLFYPFECALPPPVHYDRNDLVFKGVKSKGDNLYTNPNELLCFAIPGNHDWFDGALIFREKILQREYLGGWRMPQTRNHFALKLPYNYWVFAVDNGLTMDMNIDQLEYFCQIIDSKINTVEGEEAKVILCSHEPDWITADREGCKENSRLLNQLLKRLKGKAKIRIAGDVHHYSRYFLDEKYEQPMHWVVSGGGGAFLHPTHVFSELIKRSFFWNKNSDDVPIINNVTDYPSRKTSRLMAWRNIIDFPANNWLFDCMGAAVYYMNIYSIIPKMVCNNFSVVLKARSLTESITLFFSQIFSLQLEVMSKPCLSSFSAILFFGACCGFSGGVKIQTVLHFLVHWCASFAIVISLSLTMSLGKITGLLTKTGVIYGRLTHELEPSILKCNEHYAFALGYFKNEDSLFQVEDQFCSKSLQWMLQFLEWPEMILDLTKLCPDAQAAAQQSVVFHWFFFFMYWIWASICVSIVFSIYLCLYGYFGTYHFDEPYSSLRCQNYKNFVRFRINSKTKKLQVYGIGMTKVPKKWIKDHQWSAENIKQAQKPSYRWSNPSKFRPYGRVDTRNDVFELIDYFEV